MSEAALIELSELRAKYANGFLPRDQYGVDLIMPPETAQWLERVECDIKRMCELLRLSVTLGAA